MNKVNLTLLVLLSTAAFLPQFSKAQSFIDFSHYAGGTGAEDVAKMQVINGETYLVTLTDSPDFPVTNGTTYQGNTDLAVTKYSSSGTVLYSTYIGSLGYDNFYAMKILNGEVYILATADSSGYPVTNGSVYKGGTDIVFTKLNITGGIVFSTYLGGTKSEFPTNNLSIAGNSVIIGGFTNSQDFPVTTGGYHGGTRDVFVTKINMISGTITISVLIGGNSEDTMSAVYEENGSVYLVGTTFSTDLPVTIGNALGTQRNVFVVKLNEIDFSIDYFRYIGGNNSTTPGAISQVLNGEVYLTGFTFAQNFPVTNGSTFSGLANDYIDGYYTRLNADGSIGFSTFLGTEGLDQLTSILLSNGEVYLTGKSQSNINPGHWNSIIFKINANGSIAYSKSFSLGINFQIIPSAIALNGDLYFSGITNAPDFPVTNGSQFYPGGTAYFTHLDPAGNIVFSAFLGRMNSLLPMQYANNKFYLLGPTDIASYPVTDSSTIKGSLDNVLAILKPDGTNIFGTYIGGTQVEIPAQMAIDANNVYLSGTSNSPDYPVTDNILEQGPYDQFLTKISFCPSVYDASKDTLTPAIQTVCKFGLAQLITGEKISIASSALPPLFLNGIATPQTTMIEASYQWQVANSLSGPWTDIPAAIFKDYRPALGGTDQYFRRLSFASADCGAALIHISDTAVALVNNLSAPVINTTGPFVTCPGSAITIGGSPTASAGNPPYTLYNWDMGAGTDANPVVSPNNNTIYTLIVTDNAGCQQIGQFIVLTYKADAGPDKSNCAGVPVKIGTAQISAVSGINYTWQPGADLSGTTIAQPFANPPVTTDFTLTLIVVKSGGGTCSTTDIVRVTPVAAPLTPNFAGPDRIVCLKSSTSLGTPAEPGYSYIWSPGSYLTSNTTSTTNYYAGNLLIPNPDPAIINLTAQKEGCSFTDQVIVTTIESRAGFLECGPRIVGLPDRTANVNETYLWTRISGPGNFTGATNLPQVPVSASVGGTTIYGLTVSYNGGSCFSQVDVPEVCIGCNTHILVDAKYGCPGFGINGGDVTLTALTNLQDAEFTWTPQAGLSAYTGSIVHLIDNVPRTYTVTATNINDTSRHCSDEITVNDPAFSIPLFSAPDTTACANVPISIGQAPVTGYTYQWIGPGLSNNFVSNPIATIPFETVYPVRITDGNGCQINDTVTVHVQNVQVNAGLDWQVCSNAIIELGSIPQPNTSYLWEPQSSPWQNGTSEISAQPQVQVAADIDFIVTATTSANCISKDTVHVSINNIPAIPDASDQVACLHGNVQIGSPALPGVTYQWSPATGLNDPAIAQPLASPTSNTIYSLVAIFPGSCVSAATDDVTVTVSDPSFYLPDINYCPGDGPFALGTGAPINMTSYSWTPPLLVTDPLIPNPSTLNPPPASTTIFTLTVINGDGCSYTDSVFINPLSTLPLAGTDKTICKGQTTTIGSAANPTGPSISYSWSPATGLDDPLSPNPLFTGTTGGIFTYVLIKSNNSVSCITTDTVIIKVIDSLLPLINSPVVCSNSCIFVGVPALAGVQYQWAPVTGLSNPNIANPLVCVGTTTVSYTLTATSVNGCSSSANIVIAVNNLLAPQVSIPTVTACIGDNNVTFNPVVTPPGNYSYLWAPDNGGLSDINIASPEIFIGNAGISQYALQVTDNVTGCTNTEFGNLVVNNCTTNAIIGDYMWFDNNTNGLQDPGEPAVSGVVVNLFNSAGFNVATTVTDANGIYLFSNVPPGNDYYVIFNIPNGFSFTTQNVGGVAAANNSKADVTGRTNNFNVPAGANITNIDAGIRPTGCVPVSLLNFTAILHNREVNLYWQTTAEYNNAYFYVERSNDGTHFTSIGRVNGNGTTSLPHNYSLLDPHPQTGMNYYRLKQVDFDGYSAYSYIIPVQLNSGDIISAYYNNLNNTIQVVFNKPQDNIHLKLYASNGQLVRSVTVADNTISYTLSLPALASGIYMLQMGNISFEYSMKFFIRR